MLISISGSQGSGKSTVIEQLKAKGFNTIDRKTSRSILKDWGVSLDEVNNNSELTIQFQDEITSRKWADEVEAIDSSDLFFTERSHADLFTYAAVAIGENNKYSDWLDSYYTKCIQMNQYYSYVFYLEAGKFSVTPDGTRGANQHYSRLVDLAMLDFTKQMVHNSRLAVIGTPDLKQRVDIISVQSTNLTRL